MRSYARRRLLILVPILVIVAILALIAWGIVRNHRLNAQYTAPTPSSEPYVPAGQVEYGGVTYLPRSDLESILFIGLDREQEPEDAAYNSHAQSDFLALLILDHSEQTYRVLHLNRDTMTDIPVLDMNGIRIGYNTAQLALSHSYGAGGKDSCINTVKAVSRLLYGITLNDYLRIPVQSMATLNDDIGGVTVTIEDDFSAVDPTLVQGETIRLSGSQAETFLRSRGGMEDSSNLARMKRQQQYMLSFLASMGEIRETEALLETVMGDLADNLVTNLSLVRLNALAGRAGSYTFAGLLDLPGEAQMGRNHVEYVVDEPALRQLVLDLFYRPIEGNGL